MAIKEPPERLAQETAFEERRGVTRISVERGLAQIHVSRLAEASLTEDRLNAFLRISGADIRPRFPRFTPSGASFLVPEGLADSVTACFRDSCDHFSVRGG